MRKVCRWVVGIVCSVVLLLVLAIAVVYIPPVQNALVQKVSEVASESMDMELSVRHVRLRFPLDLVVEGVTLVDSDTIAHIERVGVGVKLFPLLRGQVKVDELDIENIQFNTSDLIASVVLRGQAEELRLRDNCIYLSKDSISLDDVLLSRAQVDIVLKDTLVEDTDTTATELFWKINVGKLALAESDISFSMLNDSLTAAAQGATLVAHQGLIDLHEGVYTVAQADLRANALHYDQPFEPYLGGLDFNHISVADVSLTADALSYTPEALSLRVQSGTFKEASGLELKRLSGELMIDSTSLNVSNLSLSTPFSSLFAEGRMAFDALASLTSDDTPQEFDEGSDGELRLKAEASLGRSDVLLLLSDMPQTFKTAYPFRDLSIAADFYGSLQSLHISSLSAELPTAFSASVSGRVGNVMDLEALEADVDIKVEAEDISFLSSALFDEDLQETLAIPNGLIVNGSLSADRGAYAARLTLSQGGGTALLDASLTYPNISYNASLETNAFPLQHFLKGMELSPLSLQASVEGRGIDLFSKSTYLQGEIEVGSLSFSDFVLDGTAASIFLDNAVATADITSGSELVRGSLSLAALLASDNIKGTLACSLDTIDLYGLGLTDMPLTTSLCAHIDVESDLEESHSIEGLISDIIIADSAALFHTRDLDIQAFTRPDSTHINLRSGDLDLLLNTSEGYMMLASLGSTLTDELLRQLDRKYISQDTLKALLPIGQLTLRAGRNNILYGYLRQLGYSFRSLTADISSSPLEGINGYAELDSLCLAGLEVDTVCVALATDEDVFKYTLQAVNDKSNPLYAFALHADGSLFATGSKVNCTLYDANDEVGVSIGLSASLEKSGVMVSLTDERCVLGYQTFDTNEDNYVFINDDGRIAADLSLQTSDGTGLSITTDNENTTALQDLTLDINNLNITPIIAVIPYCPAMKGVLSCNAHVVMTEQEMSVSSSVEIKGFEYEGIDMGDLATEFVYMPLENDTHYLDGLLSHNGEDVATISGTYAIGETDDYLSANVSLTRLPLNLANGFIPDMIVGLKGYGDGQLSIEGALTALQINGTIDLDSAYLVSVPYGIELNIDDKPLHIKDSKVLLEDFKLFSHNEQPLVINGDVDCTDLSNMATNLRMTASNWLIIDAKENRKSEAFGKAYVNLDAQATGPLASMKIVGSVDVLGGTDLTYVLRDSPISTDNAMEGLVQFTDLSSNEETIVTRPTVEGPYIDLRVAVAQDVRIFVALNAIKTNYIDMTGGGELRMIYSQNDIRLTGRYTIEEGEMKYSLPVIPLKTFTIAEGSYVEFNGEVMNPALSIEATEQMRSNAMVNGVSQTVTFNCGVSISQTLENMGLEFIVEAPENMTIDSELQAMSSDERSKIAVTLLTTGMYLSDNSLSSFSMNSALSSFLQNEINNISNNALRTLDLSIGIDNTTDEVGDTHTDYTFKFAKRLWNNRVRLVVGGKVSSNDASMENLFDNVAVEYRLDKNAYTNLRLFYDRSTYDYLEGYVGQYGVGLVWKRQLQSFKELFKRKKTKTDAAPADSLTINKEEGDAQESL